MAAIFKDQVKEDIRLIQKDWKNLDNNLTKDEYAFNYWVLSRLFDVEEELIPDMVTEYNDKSIDCYVHFEDSKDLYLIQNKYYDDLTPFNRNDLSDFLVTPLNALNEGNYRKSKELQKIFDTIKDDPDYKIHLHFYVSNNKHNLDAENSIKYYNNTPSMDIMPLMRASIFYLDDIQKLYYGESFKDHISFRHTIKTKVRANILRILPDQYEMEGMSEAYYVLTPVAQLYYMYKEAINKNYPLFEENIREYLGRNSINKGIITTLKDRADRSNFFYYNNGITVICSRISTPSKNSLELIQPQIVNGCQTVNSIYEVLNDYPQHQIDAEFNSTYVMVKVLLFNETTKKLKTDKFYKDIVKFNNKQNAINENAFGARKHIFEKIQTAFKERGFLLLVKPSDRNTFNNLFQSDSDTNNLLKKANSYAKGIALSFSSLPELYIPLEKLLQVYLAFIKDGYYAFTKKNVVLKQNSDIYKEYSIKINDYLTHDNLIRLYLIYLKAEINRSQSEDKKTPVPYYLIGFLGRFIKNKEKLNIVLPDLFAQKSIVFNKLFDYLQKLTIRYRKAYVESGEREYNQMIKRPIDEQLLDKQIDTLNDILLDTELKEFFESLN